ncbi:MAG: ABC transporter permease [Bacillota bacterium]
MNPQGNIPPTLLDRPLVSTASVSGPRNVGIVVSWTPPPTRLWAPGPAATPRQLAMQLRTMYNITYTTETAGFWGWDSLPVFITGDWARHVTTILSWNIYAEGSRILGVGYAFIALGIYSVLIIALISRRRELAINKTIGLSPRQLVFVFGLEVAAVSTVSFAVSTIAVSVLGNRVASVMGLESRVSAISVLQTLATMGTLVVMASIIPLAMAAAATVNQLLYGQKIYLFKRRVLLPVDGGGER